MNTALQTFQFDGIPVSVVDQDGEGWMIGEDIGKALDYSEPRKSINNLFDRNRDELEEYSVDIKLMATDSKQYDTRVYNEEGVMMIGFLSKQPKAVAFRKWAVKILKAYRHKELVQQSASYHEELKRHWDTRLKLEQALNDQITYLQSQLAKSLDASQGMLTLYSEEEAKVNRLTRSRGKLKILEQRDIFAKLDEGWEVPQIAKWMYRSTDFVKAVIKRGRY